jgi:hypothetical protein
MPHTRPALLSLVLSIAFCACTRSLHLSHPDSDSSPRGLSACRGLLEHLMKGYHLTP